MSERSLLLSRSGSSRSGWGIGCIAVLLSEASRGLDHERVDEGLREVPAHLVLVAVVFLAVQLRGAGGRAGALEPRAGLGVFAPVVQREGHQEPAQQERALRLRQGAAVVPDPIG